MKIQFPSVLLSMWPHLHPTLLPRFGIAGLALVLMLLSMLVSTGRSYAAVLWQEGFESVPGDWTTEGTPNVWEIGEPTAANGPRPRSGKAVAGTTLGSNTYVTGAADLISPEFVVPLANERPRLRYWDWHETTRTYHYGRLYIRVNGGSWVNLGQQADGDFGRKWSQRIVDLRAYGGQTVQIAFGFSARTDVNAAGAGWYIDDVSIETGPMQFNNPESFENGFGDWSVNSAIWEIGEPTAANGPQPRSGKAVAGTTLGSNSYVTGGADLISPEFVVPLANERPRLRYWDWHETTRTYHYGRLYIRVNGGS
ncbi:MAG: choice-of-anchor J domain-containing protein, partial [Verrucomicrobia bacterium]|nr:choice-of-anchor J domain-containing protein [Verrucomicrobiota bacterium]